MDRLLKFTALALICLLFAGCSASLVRQGEMAIEQDNLDQAATHFQQALDENPDDVRALTGLGRVHYTREEYARAEDYLASAHRIDPADPTAAFYLGLAREQQEEYAGAEGAYEAFLATDPDDDAAKAVRGRLLYLRNQALRKQSLQAIRLEQTLVTDTLGRPIVAVLPFTLASDSSDSLASLAKGVAAAVTYDLFQVKSLRIVERMRLNDVLAELALVESGSVDLASAPRLGRIVGADHLVNSSMEFIDNQNVSVQTGIVEPSQALFQLALTTQEEYLRVWKLQKDITFAIIDSLGVELTPAERNAIEKIPTESFPAFFAFSKGIEQLDQGNVERANEYFAEAAQIDPGFQQATEMEEETGLLLSGSVPAGQFESMMAGFVTPPPTFDLGPTRDFFNAGGERAADPRDDDDPAVETGRTSVGGTIP
ncbi:MAG: tetratricopeptide repeat protein [candidate division Zixibacteria bacterium]|nr:tetratricopeptide repeat protein [candidate division Zixibacteria bacterium]